MAGASINSIKSRIKSVSSTMQITKAMELVATSKLRRAKERAERTRPFSDTLLEAIESVGAFATQDTALHGNPDARALIIVLAGDRGLAGGYNSNIFKLAASLDGAADAVYLPIGKKAVEYYSHRSLNIYPRTVNYIAEMTISDAMNLGEAIFEDFKAGRFSRVEIVYTKFASMISQIPTKISALPIENSVKQDSDPEPLFDGDADEMLERIIPTYIAGLLHSAVAEALASESGARRSAMNSANKNAEEMIASLRLGYNRARQAVITQEITEIVSGADAMK